MERATYLIDKTGIIRAVWRPVSVAGHVEAVLEAAKGL
jgi:peroxiredoxin Q/BCP